MEFRDLKKQYKVLKKEIDEQMQEVLTSAHFISGSKVTELEEQLAEYTGSKYCIACANGTDALSLALMAWNIKENDAVFVPDFTFFSTAEVVSHIGATPIFVDVQADTKNIDPDALETAIQKVIADADLTPKAIIAVDLFGLPADYPRIKEIAQKYNLLLLEDGAQGFGGKIGEKVACSFGDISTTSFFPAKPLGCYGDGGAVFTDNKEWADKIRSLHIHGKGTHKYDNLYIGLNSRLDTLQAAVLLPKFKAFKDYEVNDIHKIAMRYNEALQNYVTVPVIPEGFYSSWAQYTIQLQTVEERDSLQGYLKEKGIPSVVYYPKPLHAQPVFAELSGKSACPVADELSQTVLSLPIHPYLEKEEQDFVIQSIRDFYLKK